MMNLSATHAVSVNPTTGEVVSSLPWASEREVDAAVAQGTKPEYWAADGVHPTLAGHMLMAKVWSETTGLR